MTLWLNHSLIHCVRSVCVYALAQRQCGNGLLKCGSICFEWLNKHTHTHAKKKHKLAIVNRRQSFRRFESNHNIYWCVCACAFFFIFNPLFTFLLCDLNIRLTYVFLHMRLACIGLYIQPLYKASFCMYLNHQGIFCRKRCHEAATKATAAAVPIWQRTRNIKRISNYITLRMVFSSSGSISIITTFHIVFDTKMRRWTFLLQL